MTNDEWKGHPKSKYICGIACTLIFLAFIDVIFLVGHYQSIGGFAYEINNGNYTLNGSCHLNKDDKRRQGNFCITTEDVYMPMWWHQTSIFILGGLGLGVFMLAIFFDDKWKKELAKNPSRDSDAKS